MSDNLQPLPSLNPGERYSGIILAADGTPSHHVIVLPDEANDITWHEAVVWAKIIGGGELPTRQEQALLVANNQGQFRPRAYWSADEESESGPFAYKTNFHDGYQSFDSKLVKCCARAIRRVPFADAGRAAGAQVADVDDAGFLIDIAEELRHITEPTRDRLVKIAARLTDRAGFVRFEGIDSPLPALASAPAAAAQPAAPAAQPDLAAVAKARKDK